MILVALLKISYYALIAFLTNSFLHFTTNYVNYTIIQVPISPSFFINSVLQVELGLPEEHRSKRHRRFSGAHYVSVLCQMLHGPALSPYNNSEYSLRFDNDNDR